MKIYINSKTKEGAWGGGNQFLKALGGEFKKRGVLADSVEEADAVLFNSYQDLKDLFLSWFLRKNKKRIYRLGPVMSLHRVGLKWKIVDMLVVLFANFFSNMTIFQSKWSYDRALELGFFKSKKYKIIFNAVDGDIFFREDSKERDLTAPIKLVYTSWSSNQNKGFFFLRFLDENLDFNKYEMKFVGNSPVSFKNIKILEAMPSVKIAEVLRQSNIFISPTKDDACSNAILEALACGLPVVALRSGANGELIRSGGELFENEEEMLEAVSMVGRNLGQYQNQIKISTLEEVGAKYISAIESCDNIQ